ncbi:MAG: lipopolysaccharide kinase InaA family protein [Flavobacterium sp.]|uniref:lipopolysaccharide kinase InaA family protein n=1 Tax=Flavobacterium sp. TaxID=239 RepID=UPI002B45D41F|nr:lipopolysaccharide kinase InaA family protein [Flavobacterium sp.]WRH73000.1 MAG: lipopolysaccharide kinase InaA family protein [Flavobacterium sp.]
MNNFKIDSKFHSIKELILDNIVNFNSKGKILVNGQRNAIKLFDVDDITLNIKSFKKPNLVNKIAYRYFRKSKASRSFEFASKLMEMQIGTPQPVAFFEHFDLVGLNESYYVCEHLENVFEFRAIVQNEDFTNREEIIRQFTRFTFQMHQNGVEFLDHSPGNTLIKDNYNGSYSFYLVDLNRMKFHNTIDFQTRMKNLSKITHKKDMIEVMSNEYVKLSGEPEAVVFETMWKLTADFQFRFHRKKRIKKKLKFWKK